MNPAVMIAIHAAAAAEKARTQVLDAFRTNGATAPDRMRSLPELHLTEHDKALSELVSAGIVRGVDARGRLMVLGDSVDRVAGYYLDEPAYVAHRAQQSARSRKQAVWTVCTLVLVAVGAVVVLALLRGGIPGGE
jgi:hypothetical protein